MEPDVMGVFVCFFICFNFFFFFHLFIFVIIFTEGGGVVTAGYCISFQQFILLIL